MPITNRDLKRRIIDISYKKCLSHLGSCLGAVDIIDEIYHVKKQDEPFILSSGHAGLALYVILEKYGSSNTGLTAEELFDLHGVHPNRDMKNGIWCSSGSLGHGLGIAVGMALADRSKNVYCLISDGECAEGSIWEALRVIAEQKLTNLKIFCNFNGWGAYGEILNTNVWRHPFASHVDLSERFAAFGMNVSTTTPHHLLKENIKHFKDYTRAPVLHLIQTNVDYIPFLKGQIGHYLVMSKEQHKEAMEILK